MKNQFYYLNRISVGFFIIALLFAGCNNTQKPRSNGEKITEPGIITKEFKTQSDKIFIITEDKSLGASISKVSLITRNFEITNEEFDLGEIDPVESIFLADLDQNGFDELYITTRSSGSGSYSKIYGFASNNNKSVTPVYVPEISEDDLKLSQMFAGFMGHNSFSLENRMIINSFPVYLQEDSNANPTGGKRRIKYELIAGESGWILKPLEIIP